MPMGTERIAAVTYSFATAAGATSLSPEHHPGEVDAVQLDVTDTIIEHEVWSILRREAGTDDPPTAQFTSPVERSFLFPGTLSFEYSLVQVDAVVPPSHETADQSADEPGGSRFDWDV
jgi:hypothetical protein